MPSMPSVSHNAGLIKQEFQYYWTRKRMLLQTQLTQPIMKMIQKLWPWYKSFSPEPPQYPQNPPLYARGSWSYRTQGESSLGQMMTFTFVPELVSKAWLLLSSELSCCDDKGWQSLWSIAIPYLIAHSHNPDKEMYRTLWISKMNSENK